MDEAIIGVSVDPDQLEVRPNHKRWLRLRLVGVFVSTMQCAGLIALSYHRWTRFALASDFAYYAQAWHRIGTGRLNPYSSVYPFNYPNYGHAFVRGHFELVMWPLSLMHPLWSSPFFLLVVQATALSSITLVTYLWAVDILSVHWPELRWPQVALAGAVMLSVAANPYFYSSATFDFHLEEISVVFLLLAAWSLWKGRDVRGVLFGLVALTFGGPVALYVLGIGVACIIALPRRRGGIILAALGLVWLLILSALNLDIESHVGTHYGYLIGKPNAPDDLSAFSLAFGLVLHPRTALHVFRLRWHQVYKMVASAGLLGLATPFGLVMAVFVLVPNALNLDPGFISDKASFQSMAAIPFVLLGSLSTGIWLARRFGRVVGLLALALVLLQTSYVSVSVLSEFGAQHPEVDTRSAAVLARSLRQIPSSAEVISSIGVMGRFGARSYVYPISYPQQIFPLRSREVVFVLQDDPGRSRYVALTIGAQLLQRTGHVAVYRWRPPAGIPSVTLASLPR